MILMLESGRRAWEGELAGRVKDEAIHMGRDPAIHCPCLANTPRA